MNKLYLIPILIIAIVSAFMIYLRWFKKPPIILMDIRKIKKEEFGDPKRIKYSILMNRNGTPTFVDVDKDYNFIATLLEEWDYPQLGIKLGFAYWPNKKENEKYQFLGQYNIEDKIYYKDLK